MKISNAQERYKETPKVSKATTDWLFSVTGPDQSGITAKLLRSMQSPFNAVTLIDFGQSVVGGALSLSFSLRTSLSVQDWRKFQARLIREAEKLGLKAELNKLTPAKRRVRAAQLHRYALTLIAPQIDLVGLAAITQVLAKNRANILRIRSLSRAKPQCVELTLESIHDLNTLKPKLMNCAQAAGIDLGFQRESLFRRSKRLVVFDMDSTLIQNEVIDELAREHGAFARVAPITERAMRGEISYDQALRERVALLRGLKQEGLSRVYARIELTPGAEELIQALHCLGLKTAVISGGFHFVADRLKERLKLHYAFANQLLIRDGKLTGQVATPIVNAARKADMLATLIQQEGIDVEQSVAIGDGANDLLMIQKAGLGIAFNAKPVLQKAADLALNYRNLKHLLFFFGLSDLEIAEALGRFSDLC